MVCRLNRGHPAVICLVARPRIDIRWSGCEKKWKCDQDKSNQKKTSHKPLFPETLLRQSTVSNLPPPLEDNKCLRRKKSAESSRTSLGSASNRLTPLVLNHGTGIGMHSTPTYPNTNCSYVAGLRNSLQQYFLIAQYGRPSKNRRQFSTFNRSTTSKSCPEIGRGPRSGTLMISSGPRQQTGTR